MTKHVGWILFAIPALATAGESPAVVLKHEGWVAAVTFSPDGKTLASAGADNLVRFWDVGTWKPNGVLQGHTDCVSAVAYSPDGNLIFTGSFDGTAKAWDPETRKVQASSNEHRGAVLAVRGFPALRGVVMFTAGVDGTIRLVQQKEADFELPRHKSWVNSLAFGPQMASGSSDGTVALFDLKKKPVFLEGGAGEVRAVAFSPDGKWLAAGNRYHTVRVWEVESKKEIATLPGHLSDVWSVAFSPDGKTLATADTDWKKPSRVKLWDTAKWKERAAVEVPGEILSIAYSPRGDWLAVGCWDKAVRVFAIGK